MSGHAPPDGPQLDSPPQLLSQPAGPHGNVDPLVAKAAADTVAWLGRVEELVVMKQRHYANRMLELQLEYSAPSDMRRPTRIARVRTLARRELADIRELLELMRDTLDQLPPQLTPANLAHVARGAPAVDAVAFIDNLEAAPSEPHGDCPICLAELGGSTEDGDTVALACGRGAHRFHRGCLREWAQLSTQCPLCREGFGGSSGLKAVGSTVASAVSRHASVSPVSAVQLRGATLGRLSVGMPSAIRMPNGRAVVASRAQRTNSEIPSRQVYSAPASVRSREVSPVHNTPVRAANDVGRRSVSPSFSIVGREVVQSSSSSSGNHNNSGAAMKPSKCPRGSSRLNNVNVNRIVRPPPVPLPTTASCTSACSKNK